MQRYSTQGFLGFIKKINKIKEEDSNDVVAREWKDFDFSRQNIENYLNEIRLGDHVLPVWALNSEHVDTPGNNVLIAKGYYTFEDEEEWSESMSTLAVGKGEGLELSSSMAINLVAKYVQDRSKASALYEDSARRHFRRGETICYAGTKKLYFVLMGCGALTSISTIKEAYEEGFIDPPPFYEVIPNYTTGEVIAAKDTLLLEIDLKMLAELFTETEWRETMSWLEKDAPVMARRIKKAQKTMRLLNNAAPESVISVNSEVQESEMSMFSGPEPPGNMDEVATRLVEEIEGVLGEKDTAIVTGIEIPMLGAFISNIGPLASLDEESWQTSNWRCQVVGEISVILSQCEIAFVVKGPVELKQGTQFPVGTIVNLHAMLGKRGEDEEDLEMWKPVGTPAYVLVTNFETMLGEKKQKLRRKRQFQQLWEKDYT